MDNDHFDAPADATAPRRPADIQLGDTLRRPDGGYLTVEDIQAGDGEFTFVGSDGYGYDDAWTVSSETLVDRVLANDELPVEGYREPTYASDDPEDVAELSAVDRLALKLNGGD